MGTHLFPLRYVIKCLPEEDTNFGAKPATGSNEDEDKGCS